MEILDIVLTVVFICVGIALVFFVIELIKLLRTTRTTIVDVKATLDPTLANVQAMTDDIKPAIAKVEPLVDRVQLTLDAVNLEMMRVDEILEDVSQITDTASSATAAVDNITNAPIKAVNNVASRMRTAFGTKSASDESTQLGKGNDVAARALEDYKAAQAGAVPAEAAEAAEAKEQADEPTAEIAAEAQAPAPAGDVAETQAFEPNFEGFEKLVSEAQPDILEDDAAPDTAVDAEGIFGAPQDQASVQDAGAAPQSEGKAYFTYEDESN